MAEETRRGDTPRTSDKPALVEVPDDTRPTAGELRKAGYDVPSDVKASEIPAAYAADTPRTDKKPALVRLSAAEKATPDPQGDTPLTGEKVRLYDPDAHTRGKKK